MNNYTSNKKSCYTFVPFKIECIVPNERQELGKGVSTPLPRSGQCMIYDGSDLFVFGGYNRFIQPYEYTFDIWMLNCPLFIELWKFNTISRCWTQLKNVSQIPSEFATHSAVAYDSHMIVYGGTAEQFDEQPSPNSVHLCHIRKGKWTRLMTHGNGPEPMFGQAVCRKKDELFVVGGTNTLEYNMNVNVLNLKTLEWKHLVPNTESRPLLPYISGRFYHEMMSHNNCLYIFGGGGVKSFPLDSLPTFDLDAHSWTMTRTYPDAASGEFPKPRRCHVLIKHKLKVYIQGGANLEEHLNDFWSLDLNTMMWQKLKGKTEEPIYFHSGVVTEEGTIYMFGGILGSGITRTNKIFKVHVDVPSLLTMAWQAIDFYAPHLIKLPYSKLLELGIPPEIAESLKSV